MKIGDKVWVITQDYDDGLMMALPQIPQEGKIVDIYNVYVGEVYYVLVDNDILYIRPENIFDTEDAAWALWESLMKDKCNMIQTKIWCKRPHPQREDLQRIIRSGDMEQMKAAVDNSPECREKRRLYEAIIKKEEDIRSVNIQTQKS